MTWSELGNIIGDEQCHIAKNLPVPHDVMEKMNKRLGIAK